MKIDKRHREKVNQRGDNYEYIFTYEKGDTTLDKHVEVTTARTIIRVKCPYCDTEYDVIYYNFCKGGKCGHCCNKYENSFAYHIQVELGEPLNKYWDWEKNTVNPYLIYRTRKGITKQGENWKVWLKCTEKEYHESYEMSCNSFVRGNRCPYCSHKGSGKKVNKYDSYGMLYPELAKYWSYKNKKSPFNVSHGDNDVFLHICEECGNEFKRSVHSMTSKDTGCKCINCNGSSGETKIYRILTKLKFHHNNHFFTQKKFDGLLGLGGYPLSYDFWIPSLNLLIEYQGEQHEKFIKGLHKTEDKFLRQKEHDRRKREYAKKHGLNLLEIWYWDFNMVETILMNEINKYYYI